MFGACRELRAGVGRRDLVIPLDGLQVSFDSADEVRAQEPYSRHAFGAQFAESASRLTRARSRVPRLLGVFAAGHILNPLTARSQLVGGMVMALSMALHEEGVMDPRFGDYLNHDFAMYHIAVCADVRDIEAHWIDEDDLYPSFV